MSKEIITPDFFTDSMIVVINDNEVSVPKKIWESRFVPCDNYHMTGATNMYQVLFDMLSHEDIKDFKYIVGVFFVMTYGITKNTDFFEDHFKKSHEYTCISLLLGLSNNSIAKTYGEYLDKFGTDALEIIYKNPDELLYLPIKCNGTFRHRLNVCNGNYRYYVAIFRDMYFTKDVLCRAVQKRFNFDDTLFGMVDNIVDDMIKLSIKRYP